MLDAKGLYEAPHLNERECYVPLGEVDGKPYVQVAPPWRLSNSPPPYYSLAGPMRQHNQYVLSEFLGLSEAEIAALVENRVLV